MDLELNFNKFDLIFDIQSIIVSRTREQKMLDTNNFIAFYFRYQQCRLYIMNFLIVVIEFSAGFTIYKCLINFNRAIKKCFSFNYN